MAVRELRRWVPLEVAVVLAVALLPFPATFPVAVPLLVAASLSRWVRGRGWSELVGGARTALAGVVVGAIAIAVAAPLYDVFEVTAVEWWLVPAARGEPAQVAFAMLMLVASAVALELALRGWILERMLELSPGPVALPIATAAVAEAIVTPGPIAARIGVALFGAGLGVLYTASGRSVLAPVAARATFVVGAVVVELL